MLDTVDAALGELLEEQKVVLPKNISSHELLQMVYRGEIELSPQQFRAAKVCLPFEAAKLSAVGIAQMDQQSFAAALERCIQRSQQPPPPAALAPPVQHSADELKRPFTMRRRNLR